MTHQLFEGQPAFTLGDNLFLVPCMCMFAGTNVDNLIIK